MGMLTNLDDIAGPDVSIQVDTWLPFLLTPLGPDCLMIRRGYGAKNYRG